MKKCFIPDQYFFQKQFHDIRIKSLVGRDNMRTKYTVPVSQ